MPRGLDADVVTGGVNLGPARRPLPVAKALHDVLLAFEMNGRPLPPDHGFPVRLVVPSWVGISSIKWVGQIEVSATPLCSPWNTRFYRLFGPERSRRRCTGHPPGRGFRSERLDLGSAEDRHDPRQDLHGVRVPAMGQGTLFEVGVEGLGVGQGPVGGEDGLGVAGGEVLAVLRRAGLNQQG
jgi:hypothetical protein